MTMRFSTCLITSVFILFLTGATHAKQPTDAKALSTQPVKKGYFLSGPYAHQNLSIYLIHNRAQIKRAAYIPLEEALERGIVRVTETGDVNNLVAENHSSKYHVFIQSGDIVKGGKQDRTIGHDVVLGPKSGKVPLNAFCVEHGRWQPRGKETPQQFSSSKKRLSSKGLKLAAKKAKSQSAVWKAVEEAQQKLGRKLGKSVKSRESETSLQLTLEDEAVQKESEVYVKAISPKGLAADDIVGYAYAINGKFNTADIYASNDLFKKVWTKALAAAVCEAVAASEPKEPLDRAPDTKSISEQINHGFQGEVDSRKKNKNSRLITRETNASYVFETRTLSGEVIHLNVIQK
jgi:hypothetical protein